MAGARRSRAGTWAARADRAVKRAALALACCLLVASPARAYTRADIDASTAAVIGESGWSAHERGEDLAIVAVHLYRQQLPANRRRSLAAVTRAYSSALNGRRPWLLTLLRGGWPRSVPAWHRDDYDRTRARIEAYLLRGEGDAPCRAEHYGSRADGAPGQGYVRTCRELGFKSVFWTRAWTRPRLGRAM